MKDIGKNKKPVSRPKVARVPVIMQLEFLECGAACLAMILAYYNKWVPLEQVRKDCGVSRDGSCAKNIVLAARSYGLDTAAYKLEPEALRDKGSFPCIVFWNFNHFVVVNGFKHDKVYINDPAVGLYSVSMEQFDKSFTGVVMFFEPTENFKPEGKQRSVLSFAKKRLQGAWTAIVFVILTGIISTIMGVISPAFSRVFFDQMLTHNAPGWTPYFLGLLAAVSLTQVVVAWISAIYSLRISGKMDIVGSTSYMWKVLSMPMEFFSQRMAGDIQSRQESNASVAESLVNTFAPLLLDSVMMVFYLTVMIKYSIPLTLIGIASIIINLVMSRIISSKRINITRGMMRDSGKLHGTTVAGIEMIESIKASGSENGFFEKWAGYQASVNNASMKFVRINNIYGIIPSIVSTFTNITITGLGIYLMIKGEFTLGKVFAFQGFLSSFTGPALKLIGVGQTLQEMRTSMERIEDVMEYPSDIDLNDSSIVTEEAHYAKLSGRVELKNVTFGYSRLAEPLIKNFNMTLNPGSKVAFVGASGCGKSTLSKLISGLYKPWDGEILFDGKSIDEIDRNVFTGSLAVVDQDIIVFADTISNNIRMWDESIENFEVILAARDAQIHDDIMMREGGYNYKMSEGGKDFSGGQRQRLEIARVLAQDPTIIIMDEATSALDAQTEFNVVNSIHDRGITTIVVAHRLSTIRDCDEIIVLDKGNVVERGTHDELMALNGKYSELVSNE